MRIQVLLLPELAEQDTDLIRDVAHALVVGGLAPVGKLRGDGDALLACSFVRLDQVVLRLDELVELLRELWLGCATEGGQGEAMASAAGGSAALFVGLV